VVRFTVAPFLMPLGVRTRAGTGNGTSPRPFSAPAACPVRPAGLEAGSAWVRCSAAGSAFRRRGKVGEVVEELRGLSKAGDEVLVEDDLVALSNASSVRPLPLWLPCQGSHRALVPGMKGMTIGRNMSAAYAP
jgi:hypothetical protein